MRVKRSQVRAIRNAIGEAEASTQDKREKHLSATACIALWELDLARLVSCLRRLKESRESLWGNAWDLTIQTFKVVGPSDLAQ